MNKLDLKFLKIMSIYTSAGMQQEYQVKALEKNAAKRAYQQLGATLTATIMTADTTTITTVIRMTADTTTITTAIGMTADTTTITTAIRMTANNNNSNSNCNHDICPFFHLYADDNWFSTTEVLFHNF